MKIKSVADSLEDKLNLGILHLGETNNVHKVPSREEILGIVTLPRREFKNEVKSLIQKFRYWEQVIKKSGEGDLTKRQEAYSNLHEIGTALSTIEERVDSYKPMSRIKNKITPSGKLIKKVLVSGLLAVISYGAFSLGASCVSNRNMRSDYIEKFNDAITQRDPELAAGILIELKEKELFNNYQIGELEKKAYAITEKGMFEAVKSSVGEERVKNAADYLRIYKDGENKEEVLKKLVDIRAAQLIFALESNILYERTLDIIKELKHMQQQYPEEASEAFNVLSRKDLEEKTDSYIAKLEFFANEVGSDIKLGDKILINGSARKSQHWDDTYFRERSLVIRDDSIGEVIGFGTGYYSDAVVVRANYNINSSYIWKTDWNGLKDYWKYNGTKNIASYLPYELISLKPIGDIQKKRFESEIIDLCNLLSDN